MSNLTKCFERGAGRLNPFLCADALYFNLKRAFCKTERPYTFIHGKWKVLVTGDSYKRTSGRPFTQTLRLNMAGGEAGNIGNLASENGTYKRLKKSRDAYNNDLLWLWTGLWTRSWFCVVNSCWKVSGLQPTSRIFAVLGIGRLFVHNCDELHQVFCYSPFGYFPSFYGGFMFSRKEAYIALCQRRVCTGNYHFCSVIISDFYWNPH